MLGKMSTTMRRADSTPISMMSRPAMAMVYGRRNARRTNPIIVAHPHSGPRGSIGRHDAPPSLRKAQSRLLLESFLVLEMIPRTACTVQEDFAPKPRVLSRPGAQDRRRPRFRAGAGRILSVSTGA